MPPTSDDDKPIDTLSIEDANVKVDLTEDDDREDQESGEEPLAAKGERERDEKGQWTRKKAERARGKKEQADWQREKAQFEGQLREMRESNERALAGLREQLQRATTQAPGRQEPQDPYAARFAELDQHLESELKLLEADTTRSPKRYNELRRHESLLAAERAVWMSEQRKAAQQRQQPQQGQNPYAMRSQIMEAEHPWLADQRFAGLVEKVKYMRLHLINVEGLPDTLDTDRQAIQQAVARFGQAYGLRQPAAPSQRTRGMYEGPAPRRGQQQEEDFGGEVEIPRELLNGANLSMNTLRSVMRTPRNGRQ